jgi:hypothetical protein
LVFAEDTYPRKVRCVIARTDWELLSGEQAGSVAMWKVTIGRFGKFIELEKNSSTHKKHDEKEPNKGWSGSFAERVEQYEKQVSPCEGGDDAEWVLQHSGLGETIRHCPACHAKMGVGKPKPRGTGSKVRKKKHKRSVR